MQLPTRGAFRVVSWCARVSARCAAPLLALALSGASAGCRAQDVPKAASTPAPAHADASLPAVLATVGGAPITMTDVRTRAADDLDRLDLNYRRARYQIIRGAVDSILRERVLVAEAQKQGKTLDDLVAAEAASSPAPTEIEIAAWYADNQNRLNGRTLDQVRPQIADLLRRQRQGDALQRLQKRLYEQRNVVINLPPFRVDIDLKGTPIRGSANAPVTLVEFSDFQCPYCGAIYPTLKRVEQTFGSQVSVAFKQFPLTSIHPYAFKAAEASLCAREQGKFWEMHDAMFQDQSKLTVTDLKATAGRLGLDQKKFDGCLDSGRYVEAVQNEQKQGTRLGINGTPAIYLNGTPLAGGAVPYEALAQAIREELARVNKR